MTTQQLLCESCRLLNDQNSPEDACEECQKNVKARILAVRLLQDPESPVYNSDYLSYANNKTGCHEQGVLCVDDVARKILRGDIEVPKVMKPKMSHFHDVKGPKKPVGAYRAFASGAFHRGSGSHYQGDSR